MLTESDVYLPLPFPFVPVVDIESDEKLRWNTKESGDKEKKRIFSSRHREILL